jgi:hypothetical protein
MTILKRGAAVMIAALLMPGSALPPAWCADAKKGVVLSTVNIKEDYEIIGLVSYRSNELDPKKIHNELTKQAEAMGADCVIGITYYNNLGYLYGSGTAVKLIKKDKDSAP